MSQVLMDAQGGRITVASRLGEGSRFGLHFPVAGGRGGAADGEHDAARADR
jgi:signal transduction histidine kinase